MLTLDDEDDIMADVEDAVSIALDRTDIDGYIDDIKLNKLAYFLIQDQRLSVSYGWYKYGPAPKHVADPDSGRTDFVEPESPDNISASDSSRMPDGEDRFKSPEEWSFFFTDEIRDEFIEIVQTETKVYLEDFYAEFAPQEYRNLYIESVRLQRYLDEIKNDPSWIENGDYYYENVKDGLFNVYGEILKVNSVKEAADPFNAYRNVLEDTIMGAIQKDNLTEAEQDELVNVINFFYGAVWDWVAHLISWNTVRGANKRILQRSIDNRLNDLRNDFDRELEGLTQKVRQRQLIPDHVEELEELSNTDSVVPPNEPDGRTIEGWSAAGAEAILDDKAE